METDSIVPEALRVKFWGVRGSYPVPGNSTMVYGGNTSCVEVQAGNHTIILDAGTGIIGLGQDLLRRGSPVEAVLFFSHLHHDHTQGFPFFAPAFLRSTRLHLFGTAILEHALEDVLNSNFSPPSFPITLQEMESSMTFHGLRDTSVVWLGEAVGGVQVDDVVLPGGQPVEPIGLVQVRCLRSHAHPGGVLIYRIAWQGHVVVYATDTEGYVGTDRRLVEFARNADLLIHDAQYSEQHYNGQAVGFPATQGWGHSTASMAIDVARSAAVRALVLFHHEPRYSDETIQGIENRACQSFPNTLCAYEGLEVIIGPDGLALGSPSLAGLRKLDGRSEAFSCVEMAA
ncbi:MAG: MBL fold metallo-hydrolase [Anaerolineales bacterium]|nr:MBL fold metallo-hydrolase [Anaerolineales bacterium]